MALFFYRKQITSSGRMKITKVSICNFRLLEGVELGLEAETTVIVGRNNSGKTSLTEFFRRLLDDSPQRFRLEDFSLGVHGLFRKVYDAHQKGADDEDVRGLLPTIETEITIEYADGEDFGALSHFVIDLNDTCNIVQINVRYELAPGKIPAFFSGLSEDVSAFYKGIKERIPEYYVLTVEAQDPNDDSNIKGLDMTSLKAVLQFGFVNAQRALDAESNKEKAVLGKILEKLFSAAALDTARPEDHSTANQLKAAVDEIQTKINKNFNEQLRSLAPTFEAFGYPGLTDPQLITETVFQVEQLLSNFTTVGYKGVNGLNLPESYNGLGTRNLIFILLRLVGYYKEFIGREQAPGIHLVFIEEPEAHLHPQMQTVFIRQLDAVKELFLREYKIEWPVQFVVTTHSSHIANEASFDSMRYFLARPRTDRETILATQIKNLRTGLGEQNPEDREFLHKYMTLTRCDLLFADRAILVEGTTERLMLPEMIRKLDESTPVLGNKYLSIMEVGGAYAHKFFPLIDFLQLRSLIITDLDTANSEGKCKVSEGTHSTNSCINRWSESDRKPTKDQILGMSEEDKIRGKRRLAFQVPHSDEDACGRSFEDAFMLANAKKFGITESDSLERESNAWRQAQCVAKTDFALQYGIDETDWVTPRYIDEGLAWLAQSGTQPTISDTSDAVK